MGNKIAGVKPQRPSSSMTGLRRDRHLYMLTPEPSHLSLMSPLDDKTCKLPSLRATMLRHPTHRWVLTGLLAHAKWPKGSL